MATPMKVVVDSSNVPLVQRSRNLRLRDFVLVITTFRSNAFEDRVLDVERE